MKVELPARDAADSAQKAIELFRIWDCDGTLQVRVHRQIGGSPFTSGIILANVARVLANTTALHPELDSAKALQDVEYALFERGNEE